METEEVDEGMIPDILLPILILAYIPFVCYLDYKHRAVDIFWYLPLFLCGLVWLSEYVPNIAPQTLIYFQFSVLLCLILAIPVALKAMGFSDFVFASCIMLFVQYTPFRTERFVFPLDFFVILLVLSAYIPVFTYAYNSLKGNTYSIRDMFTKFPGKFPYMFVISAAFLIAMTVEMLI